MQATIRPAGTFRAGRSVSNAAFRDVSFATWSSQAQRATPLPMIRRTLISGLLTVCLVLTSLAAVVAETRMAAAGDFCGNGQPAILLDATGLPLLDTDGAAITAPDCPACHLALALSDPAKHGPVAPTILLGTAEPSRPTSISPLVVQLGGHARAPPRLA